MCVCVCVCVCVHVYIYLGVYRTQRRTSNPLEIELKARYILSCLRLVPVTKFQSFVIPPNVLNRGAISPAPWGAYFNEHTHKAIM